MPNPRLSTASDSLWLVSFADGNDWGSAFIGTVTITNRSAAAVTGWTITFDLANAITNIWNATILSHVGTRYVIGNMPYNASVAGGGTVSFGFQADGGNPLLPSAFILNGDTLSGTAPPPPLPTLSVADASVTETGSATLAETFTVSLSAAFSGTVTVAYATADGTARAGTDYTAATGTLTFAPGTTTRTITVATHPGAAGTHGFTVTLSQPSGATLARAQATGTVIDPPPPVLPTVSAASVTVHETIIPGSTTTLLPAGFLSTHGNQIVDASGTPVRITAINWYGMETSQFVPQGLWVQSYKTMMSQMASLGFNAIRLPFSLQAFDPSSIPTGIDYSKNPDLVGLNALQVLDKIVAYAGQIGLKIILDDHRSAAGSGPNGDGLWYDGGYTEAQWVADWKLLAARYAGNTAVIGADLSNEPHDPATWGDGSATDWQAAATRAGNAIQSVNANWLILVEGIQSYQGQSTWWGGNLAGAAAHPVTLAVANKVVYSPHDYPASVYPQTWFSAANYPNNLPAVWSHYWGNLYQSGQAPVLVGEFGSKLQTASDKAWIASLVSYMNAPGGAGGAHGMSWAYWDWNPTSGDTGGILNDDWTTVDPVKLAAIQPAMVHTSGGGPTASPATFDVTVSLSAATSTPVTLHYATADGTAHAGVNYVATSGDLTFAPGETSKIVATQLLAPLGATGQVQFQLVLSNPSGANLAGNVATETINYDSTTITPPGTGDVALQVSSDWGSGFTANATVSNPGAAAVQGWRVEIDTASQITSLWNGVVLSHTGAAYVVGDAGYNGQLAGHGSTSFGFQAAGASAGLSAHVLQLGV